MGESENLELVKDAFAALEREDFDALLERCGPAMEWLYPNTEEIPCGAR